MFATQFLHKSHNSFGFAKTIEISRQSHISVPVLQKISPKQIFRENLPETLVIQKVSPHGPFVSHVAEEFCLFK
jgi:hypothetical protein